MEFEVNRIAMLEVAKNAGQVVPVRSNIDVLNGVLVESDEHTNEVILTATNFDISIQHKVKAVVEESGSVFIESKMLVGMLSLISSEFVSFSSTSPELVKVLGSNCSYEINCISANHYPKPVMPFPEETVKLSGICSLAKRTIFAVSKEDSKPALQCVNIKLQNNAVHAVACDGIRMILVRNEAESFGNHEFLVPAKALRMLSSISTDEDIFEVGDVGDEIVFMKENMMLTVKKIEGSFIDVNKVVKAVISAYTATTDAYRIKEAIELMIIGENTEPLNIVLSNGHVNLRRNGSYSDVKSYVPANISKDTPDTGFYYNADNLYRLFKILEGKIRMEFDARGVMLVKTKNEVYFQMPQREPANVSGYAKKVA